MQTNPVKETDKESFQFIINHYRKDKKYTSDEFHKCGEYSDELMNELAKRTLYP